MNDLRIPTHAILVQIYTDRQETLPGALYVVEALQADERPASQVLMLLNDDRGFVPFRTAYGPGTEVRDVAMNKDHIVRVHLQHAAGSEVDPHHSAADRGPYQIKLSDGTTLTGDLYVETPENASRLVDKLNQTGRFIPIVTDDGVDLVHRDHVLRME